MRIGRMSLGPGEGLRRLTPSRGIACHARCVPARGFTLLELMIVLSIIVILMGMAAGIYTNSIRHARETVLKKDLQSMREAIDNYTMDKQQAPQSLQDLVDAHYLRNIPNDPMTNSPDWVTHVSDMVISADQTGTGIDDVHAGTDAVGMDGTPYSSW